MTKFNPAYLKEARNSRAAAGSVWNRVKDGERKLIKKLQSSASDFPASVGTLEATRWIKLGKSRPVFPAGFKIDPFSVTMRGANKWGFFAGGALDTSSYLGEPPLIINTTGEPQHLLTTTGQRVTLQPGSAFDADPTDDLLTWRVNGKVTYLPGAVAVGDTPPGAEGLLDLFGGSKVLHLRTDRLTAPEGADGVTPATGEDVTVLPGSTEIEGAQTPATDGDGTLVLDESGQPILDPPAPATTDLYLVLVPFSTWILANPTSWKPATLRTAIGDLHEGTGFINGDGCIHVFQDPKLLWPDGYCVFATSSYANGHPLSYPLRAVLEPGYGVELGGYRRRAQSMTMFFKACCDAVGIPLAEKDLIVRKLERHGEHILMSFDDGNTVTFKGPTTRAKGELIRKGETISGSLTLRCKETHGTDWYRNRPWGLNGIQAKEFWPYASEELIIRDKVGWVRSYLDPVDGSSTRAKIELDGPGDAADDLWAELEARERVAGTSWADSVFGFPAVGMEYLLNPLEVLFGINDNWAAAIEGPLGSQDPQRWRRLKDFIAENKPAGSVVVLGPTYFF